MGLRQDEMDLALYLVPVMGLLVGPRRSTARDSNVVQMMDQELD